MKTTTEKERLDNLRLPLGRTLITPGALAAVHGMDGGAEFASLTTTALLDRHSTGDWGDVDAEDWQANNDAVSDGERVFSAYKFARFRLWIITEWDRSATTIMLPSEY